jgi:hypothetical protein
VTSDIANANKGVSEMYGVLLFIVLVSSPLFPFARHELVGLGWLKREVYGSAY